MKAVLVVDVEEYGDYYADVYRKDADDRFEGRYYLKPLPSKAEVNKDSYGIVRLTEESFAFGWNACLELILGDKE